MLSRLQLKVKANDDARIQPYHQWMQPANTKRCAMKTESSQLLSMASETEATV